MSKTRFMGFGAAAASLAIAVGACGSVDETPRETRSASVGTTAQAILKGTPDSDPAAENAIRLNFNCSGTLIAPDWVLTASHCFPTNKEPTAAWVYLANDPPRAVTHVIPNPRSTFFIHNSVDNVDVTLLHIDPPVQHGRLGHGDYPTIFKGVTSDLVGIDVFAFGYGAPSIGNACTSNSDCASGSGQFCDTDFGFCFAMSKVLRSAFFTTAADATNPFARIDIVVPNSAGQRPLPGDSGSAIWHGLGTAGVLDGVAHGGDIMGLGRVSYISGAFFGTWASNLRHCPPFDPRVHNTTQCSTDCPCDVGQGDCDSNAECRDGLVCAKNAGPRYGLPADFDMCEAPTSCPLAPTLDACTNPACPCTYGQGDCDGDYECGGSLVCRNHIGAAIGADPSLDLCVFPTDPGCTPFDVHNPSTTFCSTTCPCDLGEGDCDSDAECRPGLHCRNAVGAAYGLPTSYDVCTR